MIYLLLIFGGWYLCGVITLIVGFITIDERLTVKDIKDSLIFGIMGPMILIITVVYIFDNYGDVTIWKKKPKNPPNSQ
jgi:energy-coupling factor transporter transmembrane protein EcfT